MSQLFAGAALRDITPSPDLLPLPKASPFGELDRVLDTGAVRALALRSGERTVLLITEDIIGIPYADETLTQLSKATGLAEKDIFLFATHAHATPFVGRKRLPNTVSPENAGGTTEIYLQRLLARTEEAALEALEKLRPAKMGIGYGKSYLNVNRNQDFTDRNMLGVNPEGPSDKTAAVIRFEDLHGEPTAFLLNYAVHAVIMHCNRPDPSSPDSLGYSADLPGATSALFEKKYPGAVALWTSGAAGDQNPIYMTSSYYPDPETGAFAMLAFQGGGYELLQVAAYRHFDDLRRINETIRCTDTDCDLATAGGNAELPGRKVLWKSGVVNLAVHPDGYINEGTFSLPMRVCRIGTLKLCCVSGELYTTLGSAIKAQAPDTLVLTHNMDSVGYIPDDEAIEKVSFGAAAPYQPGYAADLLPAAYLSLLQKSE